VCVLRRTGEVTRWGSTQNQRRQDATLQPTAVEGVRAPDGIAGGLGNHFCAHGSFEAHLWGDNAGGAVGGRGSWIGDAREIELDGQVDHAGFGTSGCVIP